MIEIIEVYPCTAPCKHVQNDGTADYVGLKVRCNINGIIQEFFLRTSEALYPGNSIMLDIVSKIGKVN